MGLAEIFILIGVPILVCGLIIWLVLREHDRGRS
jgi:hypothetical protein